MAKKNDKKKNIKKIIKGLPESLQRSPKAKKIAEDFVKANPATETLKIKTLEQKQEKAIQPLIEQSENGEFSSPQTNEKFEDLFQLIINTK